MQEELAGWRRELAVSLDDMSDPCNHVFLSGAVYRASLVICTTPCVRNALLSCCCWTAWLLPFFFFSFLLGTYTAVVCAQWWPLINALFCVVSLSPPASPSAFIFVPLLMDLQWDITAMQVSSTHVHVTYSCSCTLLPPNYPLTLGVA